MLIYISLIKGAFLAFLLSIASIGYAEMYKCKGKSGAISYQATPCNGGSAQSKIKNTKNTKNKKTAKNSSEQCKSSCNNKHLVCVSALKNGTWNSDGGLELCKEETKACDISCTDLDKGNRAKSSAKFKRSLYNINKKYEQKSEKRKEQRKLDAKRKCATAKSNLEEAQKAWDAASFGFIRKLELSDAEKRHYLNKIETASNNVRYDCN